MSSEARLNESQTRLGESNCSKSQSIEDWFMLRNRSIQEYAPEKLVLIQIAATRDKFH